jgi:hypothetical protein
MGKHLWKSYVKQSIAFTSAVAVLALAGGLAQAQEGPVPTQVTVSVDSKQPVPVDVSSLKVKVNGKVTPLISFTRVQPQGLEVAVLIDDGLRSSFANQLGDMRQFITSLPPGVNVLVGYMQNGRILSASNGFSTNHEAVAGQVRIPSSIPGVSASPYFCLSDFVKHWPSSQRATRAVLMLTNGIDPYNGSPSVLNQDSPYVENAVADAQRAGVAVYSIPYHEAGLPGGYGSFSGQSYLEQVADGTGGRLLYLGSLNPVDLTPFLNEFLKDLRESYTAAFDVKASSGKYGTLEQLKISSAQSGVKIHAPEAVHAGGADMHEHE